MGIIKGFTFDDIDSLDYSVGITGEAVYNAPSRDVEMFAIPGRSGEFALDKGRFNNIEITYPAGIGEMSQSNFAQKVGELRNALCSKIGYKRLEDEYHTDEYRMAIYKSGLDVSPTHYNTAGQFDITFDCKPQRFLKSGETEQTVVNGGNLLNPTLFESNPLVMVQGYGTLNIGDKSVRVDSVPIGNILLSNGEQLKDTTTGSSSNMVTVGTIEFDETKMNSGDIITLLPTEYTINVTNNNQ